MIILSASGFEPAYRDSDITVVLTLVNTGTASRTAIPAPGLSVINHIFFLDRHCEKY